MQSSKTATVSSSKQTKGENISPASPEKQKATPCDQLGTRTNPTRQPVQILTRVQVGTVPVTSAPAHATLATITPPTNPPIYQQPITSTDLTHFALFKHNQQPRATNHNLLRWLSNQDQAPWSERSYALTVPEEGQPLFDIQNANVEEN